MSNLDEYDDTGDVYGSRDFFNVSTCRHYETQQATGYAVWLPHQCDYWEIAGAQWGEGETRDEAIRQLEEFLADGAAALAALKAAADVSDPPPATLPEPRVGRHQEDR